MEPSKETLYVFLDESGDMDFNPKASTHFIVSGVMTVDPYTSAAHMQKLKYELMAAGSDDLEFHATVNTYGTRKRVAEQISQLRNFTVHTMYIDKRYAHPSKQSKVEIFSLFGKAMGRWIAAAVADDHDQVVMMFDSVLTKKEQGAFKAAVKPILKQLPVPFRLQFHPVKSDLNGQIADYFSWSWYRNIESGDQGPMARLAGPTWTQFNLWQSGHTIYWQK